MVSIDLSFHILVLVRVDTEDMTIGTLDAKLTDEEIKYLEEPYTPVKIAGHN